MKKYTQKKRKRYGGSKRATLVARGTGTRISTGTGTSVGAGTGTRTGSVVATRTGRHTRRRKRKSPERCAICQESLHNGKQLYTTVCAHRFHKICLAQLCRTINKVCPICRNNITSNCEELALSAELIQALLDTASDRLSDWPDKDEILEKWREELTPLSFDRTYQYERERPRNDLYNQALDMIERWDGDGPLVDPHYYEKDYYYSTHR